MKADSFRILFSTSPNEINELGVSGWDLFEYPEVVNLYNSTYGINIQKDGVLARLQVIVETQGQGQIGFIDDVDSFCDLVYGTYDSMGYNAFKHCCIVPDPSISIDGDNPYVVNLIIHQA
nr:MAG TPA_asm: hypothetical protein [Bacteriophage sp.]